MTGLVASIGFKAIASTVAGSALSGVKSAGNWLSHRSFWQLVSMALAIIAAWQFIAHRAEVRHSAKLQTQVTNLSVRLGKITTAKNDQKVITRDRIKVVTKTIHDADQIATKVEQAPPAPNCKTKQEVLNADL